MQREFYQADPTAAMRGSSVSLKYDIKRLGLIREAGNKRIGQPGMPESVSQADGSLEDYAQWSARNAKRSVSG